jgi:uncharacterized membrane protein (UPF0182 family)
MRETLEAALADMFGDGTASAARPAAAPGSAAAPEAAAAAAVPALAPPAPGTLDVGQLSRRASTLYQQATDAQRAGDWAGYGQALNELGETLRALEKSSGVALPPPVVPAAPPAAEPPSGSQP